MWRSAIWALLLCLTACEEATPLPEGGCAIQGVVTKGGKPVVAQITAVRYAGLHAMRRWATRMPGHTDPAIPDRTASIQTTSDQQGRYVLSGLPPGVYAVTATDATGHVADEAVVLYADGMLGAGNLALGEATEITGRLVWQDGVPLPGEISISTQRGRSRAGNGPYNPWWHAFDDPPNGPTETVALGKDGTFDFGQRPASGSYLLQSDLGNGLTWHGYAGARADPLKPLLPATQQLRGRVVTTEGQAVAGAEVRIRFWPLHRVVMTDASGAFEALVRTGCYVEVHARGFQLARTHVVSVQEPVVITLEPETPPWKGQVVQADGNPAPGARIVVIQSGGWFSMNPTRHVVADAAGRFVVAGRAEKQNAVFVRGGGWVTRGLSEASFGRDGNLRVPDTPDAAWKLVVEPSGTLRGRVVDARGKPLAGMQVRAMATARRRTRELPDGACDPAVVTSQPDGTFTITDTVPGWIYEILVTGPDRPDVSAGPFPIGSALEPFEIQMPDAHWLDVRVLDDATGVPIEGAYVPISMPGPRWAGRARSQESDAQGWARFGPLPSGSCHVTPTHRDYVQQGHRVSAQTTTDPKQPGICEIRLVRGLTISGTVLGALGLDRTGVRLTAHRIEGTRRHHSGSATPDAHGAFTIRGLAKGSYELQVRSNRARKDLEVEAGATDLEITLEPVEAISHPMLRVEVTDPDGLPIPLGRVSLVATRGQVEHPLMDGVATFRLDPKSFGAAGPLHVVVTEAQDTKRKPLPWGLAIHGPIERTAGTVKIQLEPERSIEGLVLGTDGKPVAHARVSSTLVEEPRSRGHEFGRTVTDKAGRFRIGQLGTGRYRIEVSSRGDYLRAAPVEATAGDRDVRITLEQGVQVVLTIVDPAGRPVSNASVRAVGRTSRGRRRHTGTHRARTIADGTAHLRGMRMDAPYSLEIHAPGTRLDLRPFKAHDWTPATMTIRLEPGLSIAGEVRDTDGNLVDSARIYIRADNLSTSVDTIDGRFRRDRLPHTRTVLRAWWPTATNQWDNPQLPERTVTTTTLDLVFTLPKK